MPKENTSKELKDIPFSVLDLAPIIEGGTAAESFRYSLQLAQKAEEWGFNRYWVAEHHSMPGIASSATSVVIGYIASGTENIRVGSGGIMLPNHPPLVIAEQFGSLESMYPGRIDLGLGRAPGTDHITSRALRRDVKVNGENFPEQVAELRGYLDPSLEPYQLNVHAVPGEGLTIPIWLLGSSGFSARLAGELGLPFSFASHFAAENTLPALDIYRTHFQPSQVLDEPYVMLGANVIIADSEEKANMLATSQQQQFLSLVRGKPGRLQPPVDDINALMTDYERLAIKDKLNSSMVGTPSLVKEKLQSFLDDTGADEIIVNSQIFDHHDRLRSYELLAGIIKE
ncbi:luciferase family oxidoreductase group 1 [Scopulibacillus darangshiensis]|uniref:Luciferase family oxidoreductase group 1 n=1 Tax=Scopulibacillus darangshiensis TaxID=442528 RepID=A0A4R2P3Z3_9BACL|nr:LLM class flavin-dependent oxidoreductase [Scopulibacillus darangshiensis]TCP29433.1 luciferase family oxidoreductase group 1 [Scopulibacillus darangshiensis]